MHRIVTVVVCALFSTLASAATPSEAWRGNEASGKYLGQVKTTLRVVHLVPPQVGEGTVQQQLQRRGNLLLVHNVDWSSAGHEMNLVGKILSTHVDPTDQSTVLKVEFSGERLRRDVEDGFGSDHPIDIKAARLQTEYRFRTDGTLMLRDELQVERGRINVGNLLNRSLNNLLFRKVISATSVAERLEQVK
jgi:hypothetical protein